MSRALYGSIVPSYICKKEEEMPEVANDKELLLRLDEGVVYYYDADHTTWRVVGEGVNNDDDR